MYGKAAKSHRLRVCGFFVIKMWYTYNMIPRIGVKE